MTTAIGAILFTAYTSGILIALLKLTDRKRKNDNAASNAIHR